MSEQRFKKILHMDLDCFFVSVERVLEPSLNGRPVIVSGNPEGRGVVSSASYEARGFGVRSGMPIQRARKLCPEALVIACRMSRYAEYSEKAFELLREFSPLVEEASIDEAYLDLTGTEKLFGEAKEAAGKIRSRLQGELGLPASIGIASNKLMAKISSQQAKPGGIIEVLAGGEQEFLAELPVGAIPGIGGKTEERLRLLGAKQIKHLVQLKPALLREHFGVMGEEIYQRSLGRGDDTVVNEESAPKSLGRETTFDRDLSDPALIEEWLYLLVLKLGIRLRQRGLFAGRLSLKFRSPEFKTWTRTNSLAPATSQDTELFAAATKILEREKKEKLLIRLLGVSASDLSETRQMPLFERDKIEKRDRLFKAVDRTRERFGAHAIYPARLKKLIEQTEKGGDDE
jgi:DNA polymerase IV